ncbi:zinc-binding dehydrogenase [Paractinoplanes maris]|uniref:zinc-binding dehydrogenase n=1 Tax=Paractinoplanes maris TaxID=1734446 RepID=UPI0020220D62|nr:zinc-binding dehydrogenase [Actinoplanes maris]
MRALVVNHESPFPLALAEVPEPTTAPHEALIRVEAAAVNPGELADRLPAAPSGTIAGWEAAGVVLRPAADGSGPEAGTPVVTVWEGGAWAELRAVPTAALGVLPSGADFAAASTLPVAAGSALRALRALSAAPGRRILITGASGAVGRFAVQLGAAAGAHVIAAVRRPEAGTELLNLGAAEVVATPALTDLAPVDGVLETVGGEILVEAFGRLKAGGQLLSVGRASGRDITFRPEQLMGDHGSHGRSITTFFFGDGTPGVDADLTWLGGQLAAGRLHTHVSRVVSAADAPAALTEPADGRVVIDFS